MSEPVRRRQVLAWSLWDWGSAAWNAVIYVNQIEDERLDSVTADGSYLQATRDVLHKYGGLWFNDEAFVVTRL